MSIDLSQHIVSVSGAVEFADGKTVSFSIAADGVISRWGNADPHTLGNAVDITEAIRDTVEPFSTFGPVPRAGDTVQYVITVFDAEGAYPEDVTVTATMATDLDGSTVLVPILPYTEADLFLEKWSSKAAQVRQYHSGERDDADIVVTWIHDGALVLDVWPWHESGEGPDGFSLDALLEGTLITNSHYSIRKAS